MLTNWTSHCDYKKSLIKNLKSIFPYYKTKILQLSITISKLYILDLDPLHDLIAPLYAENGRPAKNQPEIFRSFILMLALNFHSITNWVDELKANPLYCCIIGISSNNVPSIGAHYDFIDRLWIATNDYDKPKIRNFNRKPKNKIGKNKKKPPKKPGTINRIVNQILKGRSFSRRPERIFQTIFAEISVKKSAELGLLGNTQKLIVSADGTNIETGASHFGVKICDCKSKGIYNCDCNRKFSDPNATWGWDSYHEKWFYGYSAFLFSVYNKKLKLDIPISIRIVEAARHDSVPAVISLNEFKELYLNFKIKHFIGDSAFDNNPTYKLLDLWCISAIIALNKRNEGNIQHDNVTVDENGIPICQANINMIYNGPSYSRQRVKWRCPYACKKIDHCDFWKKCTSSDYGRTFHTSFKENYRINTPIPRDSHQWKSLMKTRTTSERVNKRILNDYSIEETKAKGKKRWSWWTMIASINIHLDAQVKHAKFDFIIDPIQLIENDIAA